MTTYNTSIGERFAASVCKLFEGDAHWSVHDLDGAKEFFDLIGFKPPEGATTTETEQEPKLDYLTIRACVDYGSSIESYVGEEDSTPADALAEAAEHAKCHIEADGNAYVRIFWTLYAHKTDGTEEAIGDFPTFEHAYRMQNLLLAPMREAVNGALAAIHPSHNGVETIEAIHEVAARLDDICNQSSTEERL